MKRILCVPLFWPAEHELAIVVSTEAQQFGIELRVTPISVLHRGAQIIEVDDLAGAPERAKRILQAIDQIFSSRVKDRLA